MVVRIGAVVEGHGDVRALPLLVRRLARLSYPAIQVVVPEPVRLDSGKFGDDRALGRVISLAIGKAEGGPVIVIRDADDDCPAQAGPALLDRARRLRPDASLAVVLAKCEWEAWYLGAIESLRGKLGVPDTADGPADPESIRDAKGSLKRLLGGKYSESVDQAAFARVFDLDQARSRCDSFDKFCREVARLISETTAIGHQPV